MELAYVPLLARQRELYSLPRGPERFREYLRMVSDEEGEYLKLPLVAMNPMAREHVPAFLDALLALDADGVGARAVDGLRAELADVPGSFRVALCVCDDLLGGWTDRAATEFDALFQQHAYAKRGWICGLLWTSERYDAERVAAEARACVLRAAHVSRHGDAHTLRERLAQEGWVRARSGGEGELEAEELAYTGEVLAPLLDTRDWPTAIAALFGDAAARKLGVAPLGLAPRAGLAWASARARAGAPLARA